MCLGDIGDHPCQRGLAGARWTVQDDRGKEPVSLDGTPQERTRPNDVILPNDLVERLWTHAGCQRGFIT